MHLRFRNVNDAFHSLVTLFANRCYYDGEMTHDCVVQEQSRNGAVLRIDEPVMVTYTHPTERVLFNPARDANPFFHVYETLWMLAGRNDVASVAYYCKRMKEFSDDGETLNGAYGYRWRNAHVYDPSAASSRMAEFKDVDQLDLLVAHLKADPTSRRAVLAMWNVEDDLIKVKLGEPCQWCGGEGYMPAEGSQIRGPGCLYCKSTPYRQPSKDVCCNLNVMFSIRKATDREWQTVGDTCYLDMTVTNRSNDLLWGMLGANYVHFTVLQEYMAARLGVSVGRYTHVTNNLHVYSDRDDWQPERWLAADQVAGKFIMNPYESMLGMSTTYQLVPLVKDPVVFEEELPRFVELNDGDKIGDTWKEPFLRDVAQRMCSAWHHYKRGQLEDALSCARRITAGDWRLVCEQWLTRRIELRLRKNEAFARQYGKVETTEEGV